MDYSSAFSPSFKANTFSTEAIPGVNYDAGKNFNLSNIDFKKANSLTFNPETFDPSFNVFPTSPSWTFITAPGSISWETANAVERVDMFGTNAPPVVSGTNGMRELSISECLVEGFIRNVTVEGKVLALENLTDYTLNTEAGFVNVPVYQFWANKKGYGDSGYFVIKSIKVTEKLRDLRGDATRAIVDITMTQVPEYQVGSGRDQANQHFTGGQAKALDQANQNMNNGKGGKGGNRSGAPAPSPKPLPAGAKLLSQSYNERTGKLSKRYRLPDGSTYTVSDAQP
jgi:hypothetical protein